MGNVGIVQESGRECINLLFTCIEREGERERNVNSKKGKVAG